MYIKHQPAAYFERQFEGYKYLLLLLVSLFRQKSTPTPISVRIYNLKFQELYA